MENYAQSYLVPTKVHFSGEQVSRIRKSWREHWGFLADGDDEMSNEEFLTEAKNLGFINATAN